MQVLIDNGFNVNETIEYYHGKIALHLAVTNGREDIVWFLIEHRADLELPDKDSWPALHYAAWKGNLEIIR